MGRMVSRRSSTFGADHHQSLPAPEPVVPWTPSGRTWTLSHRGWARGEEPPGDERPDLSQEGEPAFAATVQPADRPTSPVRGAQPVCPGLYTCSARSQVSENKRIRYLSPQRREGAVDNPIVRSDRPARERSSRSRVHDRRQSTCHGSATPAPPERHLPAPNRGLAGDVRAPSTAPNRRPSVAVHPPPWPVSRLPLARNRPSRGPCPVRVAPGPCRRPVRVAARSVSPPGPCRRPVRVAAPRPRRLQPEPSRDASRPARRLCRLARHGRRSRPSAIRRRTQPARRVIFPVAGRRDWSHRGGLGTIVRRSAAPRPLAPAAR